MATIHVSEIQQFLKERGENDAVPWTEEGYFFEIRFDKQEDTLHIIDEEMVNRTMNVESPYGSVVIRFDSSGQLRSIELC